MKLTEYIKELQDLLSEHGDLKCIYSTDDEGNGYSEVHYSPSMGHFDEDSEFYGEEGLADMMEDYKNDEYTDEEIQVALKTLEKVVCIN